jgi:2'-5' RNA ligase
MEEEMTDEELIKRPLDEEFDTMMEVQRNPCGAWMAIQKQADLINTLTKQLDSTAKDRAFITKERDRTFTLMLARVEVAEKKLRDALIELEKK